MWVVMAKMMYLRPELGFSGKIWTILLEFVPFAEIWAILLGFGLFSRIWVRLSPKRDVALRMGQGGHSDFPVFYRTLSPSGLLPCSPST